MSETNGQPAQKESGLRVVAEGLPMKPGIAAAFTRAMGRAPTVADARDALEIAAVSADQSVDPVMHLYWMLLRERESMMAGLAEVRGLDGGSAEKRLGEAVEALVESQQLLRTEASRIEAAVAKGAAPAEQLKAMASDLRAIRGRVYSERVTSRWAMFGIFFAGLVVAFVCAVILHFAGHRPQGQIWSASDGLARLSEVLVFVTAVCAGVTWWTTRR